MGKMEGLIPELSSRAIVSILFNSPIRRNSFLLSWINNELNDSVSVIHLHFMRFPIGGANKDLVRTLSKIPGTAIHKTGKTNVTMILRIDLYDAPLLVSLPADPLTSISKKLFFRTEVMFLK